MSIAALAARAVAKRTLLRLRCTLGKRLMLSALRTYPVSAAARRPLINFMLDALKGRGCRIIHASAPNRAPFVFTFELSSGERMGVVAYAFLATRTPTKNRPKNERSFQVKYGSKESYAAENVHRVWRDPLGLFTTLFIGISPREGYFVSADPAMHDPTKFFIRIEFKDEHAEEIVKDKWFAWERDRRFLDEPIEVIVGATAEHFLELIRFSAPRKASTKATGSFSRKVQHSSVPRR